MKISMIFYLFFEINIKEKKEILIIRNDYQEIEKAMISIKVFKHGNELLIGACDEELLGKKFVQGKRQIDVSNNFYKGDRISVETLKKYLKCATIANLVGAKTVDCAVKMGIIDPDCILVIKGIPHAQMIRMI
ncbi:MAG: DUF424 family protein [Thermoplasmatota archaeon]